MQGTGCANNGTPPPPTTINATASAAPPLRLDNVTSSSNATAALTSIHPGVTTLISCAVITMLVIFYIVYASTIGTDSNDNGSDRSVFSTDARSDGLLRINKRPTGGGAPVFEILTSYNEINNGGDGSGGDGSSSPRDVLKQRHDGVDEYVTPAIEEDMIVNMGCRADGVSPYYNHCYEEGKVRIAIEDM